MANLTNLTEEQRAALRELDMAASMYKDAVERRIEAERNERERLGKLHELAYRIAGVA